MKNSFCPNYDSCKLITDENIVRDKGQRLSYICNFCKADKDKWCTCKRLITKKALNFCPDFVLPDTLLSPDEIIDKFDSENIN